MLRASLRYWGERSIGQLLRSGLGRALKPMLLSQDDGEFFLEWFVAEKRIDRLAASDYVLFRTVATIRLRQQMLDTRVRPSQYLLAEEALPALFE